MTTNTTATTTHPAKGESLIDCSASEAIEIWEREKYAEFVEREIAQLTQEIAADNDATAETVRWWTWNALSDWRQRAFAVRPGSLPSVCTRLAGG